MTLLMVVIRRKGLLKLIIIEKILKQHAKSRKSLVSVEHLLTLKSVALLSDEEEEQSIENHR